MKSKLLHQLDRGLLLTVFTLVGCGLILVYSATYISATEVKLDGLYYFKRQLLFAGLSLISMIFIPFVPKKLIEKLAYFLWPLAIFSLVLTLIPGVGIKVGGATRWLPLFMGIRFEPSEFLKLAFCFLLATFFSQKRPKTWKGWLFWFLISLLPLGLLLKQPDFGTFIICMIVLFVMLFSAGLKWRYIFAGGLVLIPLLIYLVWNSPYRKARIEAFWDPWADPTEKGFQMIQSLLSFYSGGLFGVGLGQGQSKLYYLPEAHTDFILAVLGEEMGFVGVLTILALFGFLIMRGLQISHHASTPFSRYLALAITMTLAFSIFINVGVVLGLLPTKGLALPFLSYGGTSLLFSCVSVGFLLYIERYYGVQK